MSALILDIVQEQIAISNEDGDLPGTQDQDFMDEVVEHLADESPTTLLVMSEENREGYEGMVKDPKSLLQELTQRNHKGLPEYHVVKESGPEHERVFWIEVLIDKLPMGIGTGNRKIDAERAAANQAINRIDEIT